MTATDASAARFSVRLTPRGGRDAVETVGADGSLRARVAAAAVEGAANRALLKLLADTLGAPVSALTIETGLSSRSKRVRIEGIDPAVLLARWPGLSVGPG